MIVGTSDANAVGTYNLEVKGYVGSYDSAIVQFIVTIGDSCEDVTISIVTIVDQNYDLYTGGNYTIASPFTAALGNCHETIIYTLND